MNYDEKQNAVSDLQIAYIGGGLQRLGMDIYDRPGYGAKDGGNYTAVRY